MPETPKFRRPGAALLLAVLFSAGMTYYHLGLFLPCMMERRAAQGLGGGYSFGNDFYPIWLTSREATLAHRNPYSQEMTREIQTGLFGHAFDGRNPADPPRDYRAFAYPAYVDLIFWPLAWLPFPAVRIALAIAFAALTALTIPLWLRALGFRTSPFVLAVAILLTLSSYAVLEGLFAVQVGLLVGFLLAASFWALVKNKLLLAGSLFALTLIKPQVSAVVAVYLLLWTFSHWRDRRRFTYGFLAWSALLGGLSLLVWPGWIPQWLHVLAGYGNYAPPPLITYSLGPRFGPMLGPLLIVVLLVAALILIWRMRSAPPASPEFMLTVSLLLALTSITLLPGQAVYDHVILLPGILLTAWTWRRVTASSRAFAVVLAAGALALFWQWIVAIPLLVVRYFLTPAKFFSAGVLLLPFHAAASVPLGVAAVLGYMMWQAIREKSALAEKETPLKLR
jgi:glycosyl transferase family 87